MVLILISSGEEEFEKAKKLYLFSHLRLEACNFYHPENHCLISKEFIRKLWWKIRFWSKAQVHLSTKVINSFVGSDRVDIFPVSLHNVFTHCCWYVGPILHVNLL